MASQSDEQAGAAEPRGDALPDQKSNEKKPGEQDFQRVMPAIILKQTGRVHLEGEDDAKLLESKGFGVREAGKDEGQEFYLKDYEVLYLLFVGKLKLREEKTKNGKKKEVGFDQFSRIALTRDRSSMTRFLIFRDLRSRGYVVREGFGFPIDFRVYDRGDFGLKAAKYIVFGLNEGKTLSIGELRKNIGEMATMGKEAVVAVVERRGEVIYYKVARWRPVKSS